MQLKSDARTRTHCQGFAKKITLLGIRTECFRRAVRLRIALGAEYHIFCTRG